MAVKRLSGSPYISILPQGFREPSPIVGIAYPTYASLLAAFDTYDDLLANEPTYEALMRGHPGHTGGIPSRPGGTGVEWGVIRNGVEWWLTDVEGLEGSAPWISRTEEPAVGDGTWLLDVRAPGRSITITGSLYCMHARSLGVAIAEVSSALAATPRTGWLTWEAPDGLRKRISVAFDGGTRVKRLGSALAEVQMSLRGIDAGTPGGGAHLESTVLTTVVLRELENIQIIGGLIPTPPTLVVQGPILAGGTIRLGDFSITFPFDLSAAQRLVIDCRQRSVLVNGTPNRSLITLGEGRWPLLPIGVVALSATYVGTGRITVEITPLW